jgi:hypothetical protein
MENREVAGVVLMVVDAYHLVAEGPLLLPMPLQEFVVDCQRWNS